MEKKEFPYQGQGKIEKKICADCDFWRGICANRELSNNLRVGRIAASEICIRYEPRRVYPI